jgi:hypothetical protein
MRHQGHALYHDDDLFPAVWIELVLPGGATFRGPAIIDSAAPRSIIPSELLEIESIDFDSLPSAPGHWAGHGGENPRECDGTIRYLERTVCDRFAVGEPNTMDYTILGLGDFFAMCDVAFEWHLSPPYVDID